MLTSVVFFFLPECTLHCMYDKTLRTWCNKNSYLTLKTKKYWKSRNKETNDNLIFGSKGAMFFFWKIFLSTKKSDPAVLNEKFEEKLAIFQVQKRNLLNFASHEKKILAQLEKT